MTIKIALAGNPNSGKTTLFNALTGSNQFVGNWPGVTVEKKEGRLKKDKDVIVVDLPGIYSLSPYSLEEVIARNFLVSERPDVIINIVDGTNIERNLYLTTQLTEIGIPVVVAINLMDVVEKAGDKINVSALSKQLGCKVVGISALKGTGVEEVAKAAIDAAKSSTKPVHRFSDEVEQSLAGIQEVLPLPEGQERFFAVKLFERDKKAIESLQVNREQLSKIEAYIQKCEKNMDDDAESIIINERYSYITSIIDSCYTKNNKGKLSTTDKIDRVVTNKWLALPIFAMVMFLVYFISVTTVGSYATDWANDGLFGDGWFLFGKEHTKFIRNGFSELTVKGPGLLHTEDIYHPDALMRNYKKAVNPIFGWHADFLCKDLYEVLEPDMKLYLRYTSLNTANAIYTAESKVCKSWETGIPEIAGQEHWIPTVMEMKIGEDDDFQSAFVSTYEPHTGTPSITEITRSPAFDDESNILSDMNVALKIKTDQGFTDYILAKDPEQDGNMNAFSIRTDALFCFVRVYDDNKEPVIKGSKGSIITFKNMIYRFE
jgi:small GTP-binding protein